MKILLVDDSATMRSVQKKILSDLDNPTILEAADGVEALKSLSLHNDVDLVVLDWNMPNMNGLECATKIRAGGSQVKILMCTTEAEKSQVVKALQAGVNNYAVKPFDAPTFMDKVLKTVGYAAAA